MRVWRTLASDQLLLFWLALVCLGGLAALWFPQAPRSTFQQQGDLEVWLPTVRNQLGNAADILYQFGFLTVTRASWFRIALAGLILALSIRLYNQFRSLRHNPQHWKTHHRHQVAIDDPAEVLSDMDEALGPSLRRQLLDVDEHTQAVVYDKPSAYIPQLVCLAGALLLILTWLWTEANGWEVADIRLALDSAVELPPAGAELTLRDLAATWDGEGQLATATGDLEISQNGDGRTEVIGLDHPLSWGGVTYKLVTVEPFVAVSGTDANGAPLSFQTTASQPATQALALPLAAVDGLRSFAVPGEDLVFQVSAEPTNRGPAVHLRLYRGREGELVEDRLIDDTVDLDINGSHFKLTVSPWGAVEASSLPGRSWTILSALIALAGLLGSLWIRQRIVRVVMLSNDDHHWVCLETGPGWTQEQADALLKQTGLATGEESDD